MTYVSGQDGKKDGCIFDFGHDVKHDKESLLLYHDQTTEVLLNRFPYANGHLLVAPSRHVADLCELTSEESSAVMTTIQKCTTILRKKMQPDGFNIGLNLGKTAGAGHADHLHFHIVPRWDGDHNFMTTLAAVRTIPQHIEKTFDLLLEDFH